MTSTTKAHYAALEAAKADMVRPWLARARTVIAARFADARAHAETGSLIHAGARLRGLVTELAGSIDKPETGLVGQARGAFYRGSYPIQRKRLDPEIHDLELAPEADDVLVAQRHPIGGLSFFQAVSDLIDDGATRSLSLAMSVAGSPDTSPEVKAAVFGNWEKQHADQTMRRVEREMKTTAIALYEAVGRLMLKPEHREPPFPDADQGNAVGIAHPTV